MYAGATQCQSVRPIAYGDYCFPSKVGRGSLFCWEAGYRTPAGSKRFNASILPCRSLKIRLYSIKYLITTESWIPRRRYKLCQRHGKRRGPVMRCNGSSSCWRKGNRHQQGFSPVSSRDSIWVIEHDILRSDFTRQTRRDSLTEPIRSVKR